MSRRPPVVPRLALAALAVLAACATEPEAPRVFDSSAGRVVVEVGGDGFARRDGVRMPLDAVILELRQLARTMDKPARAKFVVQIGMLPVAGDDAVAAARAATNRLLDELQIMGFPQVAFL